jgi:hypothetical protein
MKASPVFVKSFDLLKWVLERTETFPKSQRFVLAKRLNDAMLDCYECLLDAALQKHRQRDRLRDADVHLVRVKHYIRLATELRYLTRDQYAYACQHAQEVGRLLGAWLKNAGAPA